MASILRYAARVSPGVKDRHDYPVTRKTRVPGAPMKKPVSRSTPIRKGTITLVGAGKLAGFLAPALARAGFTITEIVARDEPGALKRAQNLSRSVRSRAVKMRDAELRSEILWVAVPDGMIRPVAESLARHPNVRAVRFAFHSSGALGSRELEPLKKAGLAVASVHPLMTFVPGTEPALRGVPFAVEGDSRAVKNARAIVRDIGGKSFTIAPEHKAAYHAWATMTSPLLLAYLVTIEEAARGAGLGVQQARRMSLPILRQTLENYAQLGAADSFTGPFVRGDSETVAKHLELVKGNSQVRAIYVALAQVAIDALPVRNREAMRRLMEGGMKQ